MPQIIMITGTDTGVGKTVVSCLVSLALSRRSIDFKTVKPIETGCGEENRPVDAELLSMMTDGRQGLDDTVFYRFKEPLAPQPAAQLEGRKINFSDLVAKLKSAAASCSLLLFEGAGGLLVPISDDLTFADLAKELNADVSVVVGSRLGGINHAALTFEVLQSRGIKTLGYVLNDLYNNRNVSSFEQAALQTNREEIRRAGRRYGCEELAYIPYFGDASDYAVIKDAVGKIECEKLIRTILFPRRL